MYSPTRRASTLALLTLVVIVLVRAGMAYADPGATAQGPATVHLPLLGRPGGDAITPTPVTPTPVTPTPEPGPRPVVSVSHDAGRAASAVIGPEGGSLSVSAADGTRFELSIPPAALDFSETITMTPALTVEGLPFGGGLAGAVSIEPAGMELYAPATLRIVPPGALPPAPLTIGFSYRGGGERFHLYPLAPAAEVQLQQAPEAVITLELIEIKPVGAGRGSREDIDAIPELTEEDLPELPSYSEYLEELAARDFSRLDEYFGRVLLLELYEADLNAAQLDEALRLFDGWLYFVESYDLRDEFATEIATAKALLAEALQKLSAASAERCYAEKRPEEGFRLLRWARYGSKLIGSAEAAAIEARLRSCLVFELTFHSQITEGGFGDPYGYRYVLESKLTLRLASGTRATGSAPLTWTEAVWIGGDGCSFNIAGVDSTFDAQRAPFGLSISPVSRTSPAVKIALHYSPGEPSEQTTILCPGVPPVGATTSAWKSYFDEMHAYERVGAGYRATAQVVGAGSFTGWVYHHTTSGPSGQAVIEETSIDIAHTPQP